MFAYSWGVEIFRILHNSFHNQHGEFGGHNSSDTARALYNSGKMN